MNFAEQIGAVYQEYFRKLHELRDADLPSPERVDREISLWDEAELMLAAIWQKQGAVIH